VSAESLRGWECTDKTPADLRSSAWSPPSVSSAAVTSVRSSAADSNTRRSKKQNTSAYRFYKYSYSSFARGEAFSPVLLYYGLLYCAILPPRLLPFSNLKLVTHSDFSLPAVPSSPNASPRKKPRSPRSRPRTKHTPNLLVLLPLGLVRFYGAVLGYVGCGCMSVWHRM
jgi:hypothetical protein